MAYTRGRCTNFDYCSIAESRRDVEVTVGEDFVCPECGKPLKAPQVKGGTTSPLVPALIGVGVLALLGGAVFLGMRMGGPAEHVVAQAPVAAPVTPPVRPAPGMCCCGCMGQTRWRRRWWRRSPRRTWRRSAIPM
jgi:hypothetical protein